VACGDEKTPRPAREIFCAVAEFNNRNERSATEFNPCFRPLVSPATGNIKTVRIPDSGPPLFGARHEREVSVWQGELESRRHAERGASLSLQHVPPLDGFGLCDPGMVQARCGDLANDYAQGFSIFADRAPQPL
jgi:hypothetical protein